MGPDPDGSEPRRRLPAWSKIRGNAMSYVQRNGKPHIPVLILSAVWLIGFLCSGAFVGAEQARPAAPVAPPPDRVRTNTASDAVTPVEGPSTLRRLGLTIEQTSIGSASWVKGIAPSTNAATSTRPRAFTGADIFRVSCQPCHTADGSGALPEVHSLLYPVQSASVTWLTDNARTTGR